MARIQKKKTTVKRKTKQEETPGIPMSSAASEAADVKSAALEAGKETSASDKDKKKKPPAPVPTEGTEASAVIKLLDKYFGTWIQFFREVRIELGKVTWPSRKQTIGSTAVVIIFVFMIAIFLGVVDFGLSSIVRLIL